MTDIRILTAMRDALTHRGPDDAGEYIDRKHGIGLGHRRLSVLDLSVLGHQPMSNDNGSVWITYNGEIYNYKEIREELILEGYTFRGESDTEVIVKAYEQWGISCVNKFIGMFAVAIWDANTENLYLVRDRAGVKPLYYYYKGGLLLFGSELKALFEHPGFTKEMDHDALPLFLRYGYIPAPSTIFKNTYKLKPGHYLVCNKDGIKEFKYWDVVDHYSEEPLSGSEDEIADELEALLADAFQYRLISDVPVGIFLSGGIDSTAVTALLQKSTSARLKTFTIGFFEDKYDEAKWAKKVANHLGTNHTEYYVSADECIDVIAELPEIYDEPFADNSGIPTYLVSKLARQDVTVALSADGGDELFCGYNRYGSLNSLNSRFSRLPAPIRNAIVGVLNNAGPGRAESVYRALRPLVPKIKDFQDKYLKWQNMLNECNDGNRRDMYRFNVNRWTPKEMKELLCNDSSASPFTYFDDTFHALKDNHFIDQMMAVDFKTWLADDILTKVDRASMRVGLESREPFLDHRLVQFAARIPVGLKWKDGISKYLLRKILYKYVPPHLIDRPKQGFNLPLDAWLRSSLYPLLMDHLNEDKVKRDGIFRPEFVTSCVSGFLNGSINVNKLWFILVFQLWKERWM